VRVGDWKGRGKDIRRVKRESERWKEGNKLLQKQLT
jgi:hypothetical protein